VCPALSYSVGHSTFLVSHPVSKVPFPKMKSFLVLLFAASSVQAFVTSPAAVVRQDSSALFAESKFGFKAYVNGQDVNRADSHDTWFPADKPLYQKTGRTDAKSKIWVPFAKDPYGQAKVIQTDEELRAQVGAEMTIDRPAAPKPKSKGAKLANGEGDVLKRYPRWIQSC
jgi:hypothetical protein